MKPGALPRAVNFVQRMERSVRALHLTAEIMARGSAPGLPILYQYTLMMA